MSKEDIVNKDQDKLAEMFHNKFGIYPVRVMKLPGAGSARKYFRLAAEDVCCIGTVSDDLTDSRAFVSLSELFRKYNINVPEVYAHSADFRYYLQQDLGDEQLFDLLKRREGNGDLTDTAFEMVKSSIDELVKVQCVDPVEIGGCVGYAAFDRRQVMWDLNYFKYEYLKPSGVAFDENALEDDFERFAECILGYAAEDRGFMYRDFQSRNVQIWQGKPWLIDFQGGRIGPRIYDIVSFLWQAKADFSDSFRQVMSQLYYTRIKEAFSSKGESYCYTESEFKSALNVFALFRTLQVLGAYGLRGLVERKAHFIESIPNALKNLDSLLKIGVADEYPVLKKVCEQICSDGRFEPDSHSGLLITVFSFSYKKGYPADYTGNGGGFMFDCRGMHNPGRYEEYKPLTGRDKPVVDFLEERGEIQKFCATAVDLVSPSVECYIRRGFSNLQIGFGCTGGRHRSVYCAERVSRALSEKFPDAAVRLIHREQGIIKDL